MNGVIQRTVATCDFELACYSQVASEQVASEQATSKQALLATEVTSTTCTRGTATGEAFPTYPVVIGITINAKSIKSWLC